jgi:hypothetical protein
MPQGDSSDGPSVEQLLDFEQQGPVSELESFMKRRQLVAGKCDIDDGSADSQDTADHVGGSGRFALGDSFRPRAH